NVAPVIDSLAATSVDENGIVHLTGTYHDVGSQDTHTLTINWGEGAPETATVIGGAFDITHKYLDDNPTGTSSDDYTIGVTLTDDDTGTATGSATATVTNVVPSNIVINSDTINENGVFTLSGSFMDPGTLDVHTVTVQWGPGEGSSTITLPVGQRTFTLSHQYKDDNPTSTSSDVYSISVTVADDDTGSATALTTTRVDNVAPSL